MNFPPVKTTGQAEEAISRVFVDTFQLAGVG